MPLQVVEGKHVVALAAIVVAGVMSMTALLVGVNGYLFSGVLAFLGSVVGVVFGVRGVLTPELRR